MPPEASAFSTPFVVKPMTAAAAVRAKTRQELLDTDLRSYAHATARTYFEPLEVPFSVCTMRALAPPRLSCTISFCCSSGRLAEEGRPHAEDNDD